MPDHTQSKVRPFCFQFAAEAPEEVMWFFVSMRLCGERFCHRHHGAGSGSFPSTGILAAIVVPLSTDDENL